MSCSLLKPGVPAFIPFLMAADPDFETFEACASALIEEGAAILEIGMPFSDPVADGPALQAAAERGLAAGATVPRVLESVRRLRAKHPATPFVLFGYLNPIVAYGHERFTRDAKAAGASALLVVDLPPEEADEHVAFCRAQDLGTVFLASPSTSPERLQKVARKTTAFLYVVSRSGVTGADARLPESLAARIAVLRQAIKLPLAVGFGISTGEQARDVARVAEGIVVGSALVQKIAQAGRAGAVAATRSFAREIGSALKGVGR